MSFTPLRQFPEKTIRQFLQGIPFYNTVRGQDIEQFRLLLAHSHIGQYNPGEVLVERGEKDFWLFFLLRGQLDVFAGDTANYPPVNHITPGEVFGDLSMLTGRERTASIYASEAVKQVLVLALDFRAFGLLKDFSTLSLQTKLAYYRNTVHNLRWKLEVYRMNHPGSTLAPRHRAVKLFTGARDTVEELVSLETQAKALITLLVAWNDEFGTLPLPAMEAPSAEILATLER